MGIDKKFRHVTKALKVLMKNVQPTEDIEVDENELEDMLAKAKEQQDKEYLESAKAAKSSKTKVYSPPTFSPFLCTEGISFRVNQKPEVPTRTIPCSWTLMPPLPQISKSWIRTRPLPRLKRGALQLQRPRHQPRKLLQKKHLQKGRERRSR